MNVLLIVIIRVYWALKDKNQAPKCIFSISCSQHVYQTARDQGLIKAIKALNFRYQNCRSGYQMITNPIDGQKALILPDGTRLKQHQIAKRLIS